MLMQSAAGFIPAYIILAHVRERGKTSGSEEGSEEMTDWSVKG